MSRQASDVYMPPQNLDAEQSLLGSLMLDNRSFDEVSDVLRAEYFYSEPNRILYETISGMISARLPVDAVTLAERLFATGKLADAGGADYLIQVMEKVPHASHAKYYAGIVCEKWEQRELSAICQSSLRSLSDKNADTTEVVEQHEKALFAIADRKLSATSARMSIKDIVPETLARLNSKMSGAPSGVVLSGFRGLDTMTSGFHPQNLAILAARPSMGKTALVCNLADWFVSTAGCPTAFFSLEQSRYELTERLLSIRTRINGKSIRSGVMSPDERFAIVEAARELEKLPLWIDDTASRTVAQIASICRRLKRKSGLGAIIIDYLQLIEPESKREPREVQVSGISRRLKQLAKDTDVPVICLSQLNRAVENREDKRPRLGDLRESGAIEQDADMVMFLHRPDAYNAGDKPGTAELILAKNRSGPIGIAELEWHKDSMRFVDGSGSSDSPVDDSRGF